MDRIKMIFYFMELIQINDVVMSAKTPEEEKTIEVKEDKILQQYSENLVQDSRKFLSDIIKILGMEEATVFINNLLAQLNGSRCRKTFRRIMFQLHNTSGRGRCSYGRNYQIYFSVRSRRNPAFRYPEKYYRRLYSYLEYPYTVQIILTTLLKEKK